MTIEIRPINEKDTDNILRWRNSKNVVENFIDRNKLTKTQHNKWLETKVKTGQVYQFITYESEDNRDFGSTYLKNIDELHRKAELGIFIGEDEYRNKGIGKIVAKKTVEFGFNKLNLNKIYARVLTYNKPSHSMFLKLGFHQDAILREDVFIDGKAHDVYIMSILRNEFISNSKNEQIDKYNNSCI